MKHPDYAPPVPEQAAVPVMTVGEWLRTLLLLAVPVLNVVLVLVWAFGSGSHPNKANFCKAYLILMAAGMLLAVLLLLGFGFLIEASGYGRAV
ncbi:MAG: hypothetical protein Q4A62_04105 [Eikenella sp.]|nr:hypothetical protein [Eikenella sp.]